ncbi:LAFA_0E15148g1_1 [Lachancea sp. 'fantastica']|nr:LAFA_0E15148g1_1 [Lachancea sp. 'fantastica']
MESPGIYGLYPLFFFDKPGANGVCYRVAPGSISKSYLNALFAPQLGPESVDAGILRFETTGPPNETHRGLLSNDAEVAWFKSCFQWARTASIRVERPENLETGSKNAERSPQGMVSIPAEQVESLIKSIQKLEVSLSEKQEKTTNAETNHADSQCDILHEEVVCDGCFPEPWQGSKTAFPSCQESGFIKGPRYKCVYCYNYDLCSTCVANGVENGTHKKYHNMIRISSPDADLNKLCSAFNSRTQTKSWTESEARKNSKFSVSQTDRDVVIDIPEQNAAIFNYFSNVETENELAELVQDHENYQELLSKVGGDKNKLSEAIDQFLEPKYSDASSGLLDASVATAREDDNLIVVEVSKREHVISFRLCNKGPDSVPSGLKLVFRCFEPPSTVPIKCTLHMGPHEFQRGHYKTLNFNCRGMIDHFLMQNTYQVDLVDHEDQVVYTGCSQGEPTICLRPLVLMGIQESVYAEARDDTSLAHSVHDDSDDHDIISNTVSNDENAKYYSDLEEYDFLSDSDI